MLQFLKCYVDLDGVLADFDTAYAKAVGTEDRTLWPTEDAFWDPILATPHFWRDIPLKADALDLWRFIADHHYVCILSSPGNNDTERACREKRAWVREHFGDVNIVLKNAKEKHHYACPNSLLIDDWHKNIKRWLNAGGKAIHHKSAAETINQLAAIFGGGDAVG